MPYPLLSDFPEMKTIRSYGVVHPSGIMARGMAFLIDKEGIVRNVWPGKEGEVAPSEPILEAARAIARKP